MIKKVRAATGADKVILVGHSMGGLAAREYLQRYEAGQHRWWIDPSAPDGHKIAKLVTIGTPHLGTNVDFPLLDQFLGANEHSEARRDLRWSYSNGTDGVYLFGGSESEIAGLSYHSVDVNCDGNESSTITGINESADSTTYNNNMPLPQNTFYTWITSNASGSGDLIVDLSRQWLYIGNDPSPSGLADTLLMNRAHWDETSDYYSIIRGLDEPDSYPLAYELTLGRPIKGFITYGPSWASSDADFYKVDAQRSGVLAVTIEGGGNSGLAGIAIYDASQNFLHGASIGSPSFVLEANVTPGTYYIEVTGNATPTSWQNPYTLTIPTTVSVDSRRPDEIPRAYHLDQNYPNPFNAGTVIRYELPKTGHVMLVVFNAAAQVVRTLLSGVQQAGYYQIHWDGRNPQGQPLPSGAYFYRLEAGSFTETHKMILAK